MGGREPGGGRGIRGEGMYSLPSSGQTKGLKARSFEPSSSSSSNSRHLIYRSTVYFWRTFSAERGDMTGTAQIRVFMCLLSLSAAAIRLLIRLEGLSRHPASRIASLLSWAGLFLGRAPPCRSAHHNKLHRHSVRGRSQKLMLMSAPRCRHPHPRQKFRPPGFGGSWQGLASAGKTTVSSGKPSGKPCKPCELNTPVGPVASSQHQHQHQHPNPLFPILPTPLTYQACFLFVNHPSPRNYGSHRRKHERPPC